MRAWRVVRNAIVPLAIRHLAAHRLAVCVGLLAMACGVAAIVATELLYESVVASYAATVVRFAGRASLQVTNGSSGVPEELADELRRETGIRSVVASVEEFVSVPAFPGERLYLYGVDLLTDQQVREYGSGSEAVVDDPLVFLAEPDSVALTASFLAAHDLKLHDRIRVATPSGVVDLTIRAVLGAQRGPASALDGRVAVVDLSVAQEILQSEARVSQLALELAPDGDIDRIERAVSRRVGKRGIVERPKSRAATFARLLANYRYGLLLASATSLVVAVYFVFSVATIAVVERRRELGLLRTIGLRPSAVVSLVVVELLAMAVTASAIGVPSGLGIARVLAHTASTSVAALYLDVGVPDPSLDWRSALRGAGTGILMPLIATIVPLRQVLSFGPLEALRPALEDERPSALYGRFVWGGGAILVGSMALWALRRALPISTQHAGLTAMLGAVVALATVTPTIVRFLATLGERVAERSRAVVVMLTSRSINHEIGRSALTCSATLVSLAGTIAIATWLTSLDASLSAAFNTVFARVDFLVSAGADPFAPEATRMPASLSAEIAALPEVAFVDPIRINTVGFDGSLISVVAGDAQLYARGKRKLYLLDGDPATIGGDLASGTAVVVNQTFVNRFHRRRGAEIELATPEGSLRVRIAGVHMELSPGDLATIHLDRDLYRRQWRDETANVLEVSLRDGVDRQRIAETIRARWGARRIVVFTLDRLRREYQAMLSHLAALVYPLVGTAVAVALVGIIAALVASSMARIRVTGLLRVVGATRAQVTRIFVLESLWIGVVATALAGIAGSALGHMQVDILMRGMLGMSVLYAYPGGIVGAGGFGVVMLTGVVGWALGRRAARRSLVEALRWE